MTKMHIVLDLDQTLIAAETFKDFREFPKDIQDQKQQFEGTTHNMDSDFIVFERPHLQDFLTFIFENFTVSVWTAASKNYASFIVKNIILKPTIDKNGKQKQDRKLHMLFFSYHCRLSKQKYQKTYKNNKKKKDSKNLKIFSEYYKIQDPEQYKNTFILDDYNEVYDTQPNNCIIAVPFEFNKKDSYNDKFLSEMKDKLQQLLKNKTNISDINTQIIQQYNLQTHSNNSITN
jgi:hypothetical protein